MSDYFDKVGVLRPFRARGSSAGWMQCSTRARAPTRWSHDGRFMLENNYRCSKDLLDACQA